MGDYVAFWKEFNKAIKLGLYEDSSNRTKLAKLLRFFSSKTGDNYTSVEKSPYLERLQKKGYEVLYYIDPIDEYAMPQLTEFKGFQFAGANKENLKLDDDDKEEKTLVKMGELYKPLTDWFKETLGSCVEPSAPDPCHPCVQPVRLVHQHGAYHEGPDHGQQRSLQQHGCPEDSGDQPWPPYC